MATTVADPQAGESDRPAELFLRSPDAAWNRERWERLPGDGNRYEVIDGVLYLSTAPSLFHQWVIHQLARLLFPLIEDAHLGTVLWSPIGVFMPGCDPVQPDLLVVRTGDSHVFRNGRVEGVPALIVEVQSLSNPTHDSRTKREAYARAGVPEYWIVRPATRDVLVCSAPDAGLADYSHSRTFGEHDQLTSATLPVRFLVGSLFAGAPDTTL